MKISRRGFLKALTASGLVAAGAKTAAPALRALTDNQAQANSSTSGEWKATICQGCTSWCSAQGYVIGGRVTQVRGNPNAKTGADARLCVRSHLSLQQLYDPDRVKTPMKRTNPRKGKDEDPEFIPISWTEAADIIADQILELRENQEPHKLAIFRGRYSGMNALLYSAFPRIIGSPNNISHSSICAEVEKMGSYYTENLWGYRDYDLEKTRYVLMWGVDPVSSNRMVPFAIESLGKVKDRGKIATVDPRLSTTATKSDEWLPIIPGEDGALATAIAHVILSEGLWYKKFVGDFSDGENRFREGVIVDEDTFEEQYTNGVVKWWNLELKDRTPQWAAERSGLPEEQIIRVARDLADAAPRVAVWLGPTMHPRGSYTAMAVQALTGLLGSVDNIGGTLAGTPEGPEVGIHSHADFMDSLAQEKSSLQNIDQRGYKEFPNLKNATPGAGVNTNRVADAILDEDPYDLKMVIAYWCNFTFSNTGAQRWEKAMEKLPFFAHITTHYAEMTHYADLILPVAHHMYERWAFSGQKSNLHTHIGIQQPMAERIFDVKNDETEIPYLIAEALAKKGFSNLLDYYNSIQDPETGERASSADDFGLIALRAYTKNIWDPKVEKNGDQLDGWDDFVEKGVWNSAQNPYRERWADFGTETGKFEFYSETLKKGLELHAQNHETTVDDIMEVTNYQARGELAFLPHYEEPIRLGEAEEYPLLFIDYKSRLNREGRTQNSSWYHEFKDVDPGDEAGDDVIKINPSDGDKLGLKSGDQVRVSSIEASITCTVKLWEGIRPGTAAKAFGQGHWAYGRLAAKDFDNREERGGNNNYLMPSEWDRLSGSTARNGGFTRVKIEKV